MTALGVFLPRILLRFGMELEWSHRWGLLFSLFAIVNMCVTVLFQADVDDQRGAYATGVLALLLTTSLVALGDWSAQRFATTGRRRIPWHFGGAALLFAVMWVMVVLTTPSGLLISCSFIGVILGTSIISRAVRTGENRTIGFDFVDEHSRFLWDSLRLADFPVLVPHRPGMLARQTKERVIRGSPPRSRCGNRVPGSRRGRSEQFLSAASDRSRPRGNEFCHQGAALCFRPSRDRRDRSGNVAALPTTRPAFRLVRAGTADGQLELLGVWRGQCPVEST